MYVFCEVCHEQRIAGMLDFYITSCSHIFCRKCARNSEDCTICGKLCYTMQMNQDLPLNVKEYFLNHAHQLGKIGRIYQFQNGKMDHFIKNNCSIFKEYEARKHRIQKLKQMYEAYKKGIADEQHLIIQLLQKKKKAMQYTSPIYLQDTVEEDFLHNTSI